MKVLATGAPVGRALLGSVPSRVDLRALTRAELDTSDASAMRATVEAFRAELVINAVAYAAVDNAQGPRQSAHVLPGCRLVHICTHYVFDGRPKNLSRSAEGIHTRRRSAPGVVV